MRSITIVAAVAFSLGQIGSASAQTEAAAEVAAPQGARPAALLVPRVRPPVSIQAAQAAQGVV
jgi:hypothetical protein